MPALIRPASAEVSSIRLGKQYGLPFLPQMVMEEQKLIRRLQMMMNMVMQVSQRQKRLAM